MTHFIFDCDDVLLDWETAFIDYVEQMTHTTIDRTGPKTWCLAEWIGCTPEGAKAWVESFNGSHRFGQLKARPGARELIMDLRNAGHTVSVLTACGDNRAVQRARVQNLLNEFPLGVEDALSEVFNQITMLPLGGSKFTYLYEFTRNRDPGDVVFVEDNFEHAQAGWINGIRSYCLRRPHNRLHEAGDTATGVIWIDDLDTIRLDFIPPIQPNVDYATRRESCKPSSKSTSAASGLGPVSPSAQQSPSVEQQASSPPSAASVSADRCNRCGTALREEPDGWSDCPRCQGSY